MKACGIKKALGYSIDDLHRLKLFLRMKGVGWS